MKNTTLVDSFGRKHDYLRISLTERCNLRCLYCMPEEGLVPRDRSHFMTSDEIQRIAETFVKMGVTKIRLTGGEPLVRKEAHNILLKLGALEATLAISSNGILVDAFIDTFKEAGIKKINISLDSLNCTKNQKISRRNYLNRILKNIDLLINEGFEVKLNMVVMKGVNEEEIIDFIELTKFKPLQVRFIEFMPFTGNDWKRNKGISFQDILKQVRGEYGLNFRRLEQLPNDTSRRFKVHDYKGSFGIISSITKPFCKSCNRIRLTADGKIKNCLFSSDEIDLLTPLRSGKSIEELIHKSIYNKKEVRAGLEQIEDFDNSKRIEENRSMVAIGG